MTIGGLSMDVVNAEQLKIDKNAGVTKLIHERCWRFIGLLKAVAVMALERVPADILIKEIMAAVTIPVFLKLGLDTLVKLGFYNP